MKLKVLLFLFLVTSTHLVIAQENTENQKSVQQLTILPLREGAFDSFLSLMEINITQSQKEEGVLCSLLYQQEKNSETMVLFEQFQNKKAFQNHQEQVYARSTNGIAPAATAMQLETIILSTISEIPLETLEKNATIPENAIYTIYTVNNGKAVNFIDAAKTVVQQAKTQDGNKSISVFQDAATPNRFVMFERWDTKSAQTSFENSATFQDFNTKISSLLVSKNRQYLQPISK